MDSPLTHIYNWFYCLPDALQTELAALIGPLHYDRCIREAADDCSTIDKILTYLKDDQLSGAEQVGKCLVMMRLIDFIMQGKISEPYWSQVRGVIEKFLPAASPDNCENNQMEVMLAKLKWHKTLWKEGYKTWIIIKGTFLSDEHLTGYLQTSMVSEIMSGNYLKQADVSPRGRRPHICLISAATIKRIMEDDTGPLYAYTLNATGLS